MRALVLAAGLGTRLGALSDERPKPLLPVADVPLIRYNLALLAAHGVREVAINLHHRGELIVGELEGACDPLAITWSREEQILGTGGGVKRMATWLTDGGRDSFLVVNGKLVIDVDLTRLIECHRGADPDATMVVREVPDAERWGAIDLDEDGRVVKILGQGPPALSVHRTMFTGVHVLSPAFAARLPDGESCAIRQGYLPALHAGARIEGYLYSGYFQEHSTPERYLEGNWAVLDGSARLRHPPAARDGIDPTATVGSGAQLIAPFRIGPGAVVGAGATVGPYVVVGRGARVDDVAHLEHTVVWPGATAESVLRDAIVTQSGVFEFPARLVE
ncbi:MAG: NDP-sugar synthase [Myxococcales bacterium]|nr:NDP-sugar synthase [Myxococcales bacterium]